MNKNEKTSKDRPHPVNKKKTHLTIHTEEMFSRSCVCSGCVQIRIEERALFTQLVTCDDANDHWQADWFKCPVCLEMFDEYGQLMHKEMYFI